jgi:large subunit ribosomal protein L7/L12
MADLNAIVEQLDQLTLLEASELSKMLQERWGVSAAAPVAMAGAAGAGAVAEEAVEEQTEFDVVLVDGGTNRIAAIKAVRELTGLGLREAKAAVEEAPTKVKEGVAREEADAARTKLEEAGAKVEVR